MHDFSRVRGHWRAFVAVLGFNHRKHLLEFDSASVLVAMSA
jgi:hypothetical protein